MNALGTACPTRRALVAAAIGTSLAWMVVVLAWRPAPFALTFDDAFYYFGIARNVAEGKGSTFDGINPTNGYHPLWLLVCIPAFALGLDGLAAVRALLAVQVVCWGVALVVVARMVADAVGEWPRLAENPKRSRAWCTAAVVTAFVLAMGNPFVVKVFVNGLESGVAVLLYALVLRAAVRCQGRWLGDRVDRRWRLTSGVLLALVFLARTDVVILLGCLGIWCLVELRSAGRGAWGRLAELFSIPLLVVVAYVASNQLWFGIPVQISGLVKRAPLTAERAIILLAVTVLAAAIGAASYRLIGPSTSVSRASRFPRVRSFFGATGWFAAFCLLLIAYYSVAQTQQWLWYYCPCVLYVVVLLVIGVADFVESALVEAPVDRPLARTLAPLALLLVGPLAVAFVLQLRTFVDPYQRSILEANRDAGDWVDANLPDDAVLGSWDAGAVGYFSQRSVMNLDGVANSYAFYEAGRDGRLGAFLKERHLGWLINHGEPVDGGDPTLLAYASDELGPDVAAASVLEQSWPFLYSGVTTGSGGTEDGLRPLAVFLYRLGATAGEH